jgi:hypothetical protein
MRDWRDAPLGAIVIVAIPIIRQSVVEHYRIYQDSKEVSSCKEGEDVRPLSPRILEALSHVQAGRKGRSGCIGGEACDGKSKGTHYC